MWAIVVAGGTGTRFGGHKQFAELRGRTLVTWSVEAARTVADGVVLVVPASQVDAAPGVAPGADVVVAGDATRAGSVRAGLAMVPPDAAIVIVHDGARPLAPPALFAAVVDAVATGADGAVPALPVEDTLKRVDGDEVRATEPRQGLVRVQTPQAFRAEVLRKAHEGSPDATDDAGLVEALGATVRVVPGDPRNIKVTEPRDLQVAEALAAP